MQLRNWILFFTIPKQSEKNFLKTVDKAKLFHNNEIADVALDCLFLFCIK